MKGLYTVTIENNKIKYELELTRNISIIKGNSGRGKSELVRLVSQWVDDGRKSGVHCIANAKIGVLDKNTNWEEALDKSGYIYFTDEHVGYIKSAEFGEKYRTSDNYLVIISRSHFNYLTYSVDCIYEMISSGREGKYVNRLSRKYNNVDSSLSPDLVLTEDEKFGYRFFKKLFLDSDIDHADGRDNVANKVQSIDSSQYKCIYIIVDGAAFGSNLAKTIMSMGSNMYIFAPESFEYLILNCDNYRNLVKDELNRTYNYCDYPKYVSWEGYYTDLLNNVLLRKFGVGYSKTGKSRYVLNDSILNGVKKQLQDIQEFQSIE